MILFDIFNISLINTFISALIASPNFLAIPILIGIIFIVPFIQRNVKREYIPLIIITSWISGALLILIIAISFLIIAIIKKAYGEKP